MTNDENQIEETETKASIIDAVVPRRVYIQFQDFPTLRLQPHKDDEKLVVAKCRNPEGIDLALTSALVENGLDPAKASAKVGELVQERFQGHRYAIAVISRETAAMLAEWGAQSLFLDPVPEVPEEPLAEYDEDAEEDLSI